jgi:hypothetical protein
VEGAIQWASTRDASVAVFALVRVGALVAGSYLLVVLVASGLVDVFGMRRGGQVIDRLTLGFARGLFGMMGLGAITVAVAPAAGAQTPAARAAVIRGIEPATQTSAAAVIRPLADQPVPTITPTPDAPVVNEQYTIVAGDSMWSVAATRLGEATGRSEMDDAEIAPYWRSVIAANSSLPNPSLLFVGQVIELPPVPS